MCVGRNEQFWLRKAPTESMSWLQGFAKAAGNSQLKQLLWRHRGLRTSTGWPAWSPGLMWHPATWEVLARLRLVLLSLKFQSNSLISRTSFLLHEKTNKTHIKCEKSHLCTQNRQMYLHRSICSNIYMQFITTLRGFLRRQQYLICRRNKSLEEEVYLLHPDSRLSHI